MAVIVPCVKAQRQTCYLVLQMILLNAGSEPVFTVRGQLHVHDISTSIGDRCLGDSLTLKGFYPFRPWL